MEEINNLTYSIQINYTNNSDVNVAICRKMNDAGLELNSIQVGNITITEETINGRVLSGRYDCGNSYCGYKYNYDNKEFLENINNSTPLNTAINLINKTKMDSEFLSAKMVISSILKNDYKVYSIDKGDINIIKTVSAENENNDKCFMQENITLSKSENEKQFSQKTKETIFKINEECILLDKPNLTNDLKQKLSELEEILTQNPNNYKDLINIKNQLEKNQTQII